MAHGLRTISNRTYMPFGNGRDWFFIGDSSYQNGKRNPGPIDQVRAHPRGVPSEMKLAYYSAKNRKRREREGAEPRALSLPLYADPRLLGSRSHAERWKLSNPEPRRSVEADDMLPRTASGYMGFDALVRPHWRASETLPRSASASRATTSSDYGTFQEIR
eukprot:TRINITY_DN61951_c0_g1_i1.p2 TRINITY_DN61951_c0_g1~~TRINITY_DN61951_c0_g1_i1.p2  ORF type:complete len:161 (+),score=8.28 TRINITY_DN61951_c0_g1_i1:74-556(+)